MPRSGWFSICLWPAGIAVAAMLAGCAAQNDVDEVRSDQLRVRGMIASQNQQVQSLLQQIRRQQDEIEELKHGTGNGEGLLDQVASLQDRLAKLEATVNALQTASPAPGPVAGVPPVSMTTPPAPGAVAPLPPAAPQWRTDLDKDLSSSPSGPGARPYREGLQAMKDGNYGLAVSKLSLLQKKFAKSPLVEPAEYFSANALFESGKYDQSILQFNDLVIRDPKGRFASASLLREAEAFLKLNDKIDARLTLQKLISDHGETAEASSANAMMKDLQN